MLADEVLGDPVELRRRDAGLGLLAEQVDRLGHELARLRHPVDFLGAFSNYHGWRLRWGNLPVPPDPFHWSASRTGDFVASAGTCSNAAWMSANTSFSVRLPRMGTRFPRVR